jgi:hypothetical protein
MIKFVRNLIKASQTHNLALNEELFKKMTSNQFKRFTEEYDVLYTNGWKMTTQEYLSAVRFLAQDCLDKSKEERNKYAS